jgi:hypothetical protein
MSSRILKVIAGVGAMGALALGGSVFAQAQSAPKSAEPAVEETSTGPDTDNIQEGDQTTPDAPAAKTAVKHAKLKHATVRKATVKHAAKAKAAQAAPATPEPAGSTEAPGTEAPEAPGAPEAAGESAVADDGPGGHADEPGNPNADHQFDGVE